MMVIVGTGKKDIATVKYIVKFTVVCVWGTRLHVWLIWTQRERERERERERMSAQQGK